MRRILLHIRNRLTSTNGETLVETLVSTLIIAGVMLMLCTAIVSAARVNATISAEDTTFNATKATELPDLSISVSHEDGMAGGATPQVKGWTQNGFIYYEPLNS